MLILRYWLPVVLWTAVILTASSEGFSAANSGNWLRLLLGRDAPPALHFAIRKTAHVVEYAILASLAWRAARAAPFTAVLGRRPALLALTLATSIALLDEGRQSLTPSRSGSFGDVLLDLAGALIAVGIARYLVLRRTSEPFQN